MVQQNGNGVVSLIEAAVGCFRYEPTQFHFADAAKRIFHLCGLKQFEASRCNTAKFVSIRYVDQSVKIWIRCKCKEISTFRGSVESDRVPLVVLADLKNVRGRQASLA